MFEINPLSNVNFVEFLFYLFLKRELRQIRVLYFILFTTINVLAIQVSLIDIKSSIFFVLNTKINVIINLKRKGCGLNIDTLVSAT